MNAPSLSIVVALVLSMTSHTALAQGSRKIELSMTAQPAAFELEDEPLKIQGYKAARFGMTIDEVKAVIAASYPAAAAATRDEVDPVTRRRGIAVALPSLAPVEGPAVPATISYVFGAKSERLDAVNIDWLADGKPTQAQRAALVAGATTLAAGMAGFQWPMMATARGHVIAPNTLIVFAGTDGDGGGVEVRLDNVAFEVVKPAVDGKPAATEQRPPREGASRLRMALVAHPDAPDVYTLPAGKF